MAKILYAENEQNLRTLLKKFFKGDHEVVDANNAKNAFGLFNDSFDVVLTDYDMDDDTGVDLAKSIRQTNKHIPIIMLSGTDIDDIKNKYPDFDDLGIHLIKKPARPAIIDELITSRVHRYRSIGVSPS